jgi:hypothetical protein
MTATVVPFVRPEKPDPHLAGGARCLACQHEWEASAPVGTWQLECPSCGLMKGMFRYPIGAMEGDSVFVCNCGCEALIAYYRKGQFRLQCMNCGEHQTEAIFG